LGVYEVTARIGEGGMGQVYRATDTTLGRQVAIKILPDAFAADADRVARLEREAKTLASLNHPHIAAIYGFEKSARSHALVMELVEGEDLSQRIARGAMPLDEVLPIAKQIAEALEAAHDQGIIHRDLKPANIKVRTDGTVKVLDFGLAKALEPAAPDGNATASPTITSPAMMTAVGIILGTAAYMSPEQAKGRPADKRSDLWAFGCVLYEMLTGARAFPGDDISDTLAAVLRGEPDWRTLPTETPASIRRLLRRCLEKDRKRRLSDAADARLEIEDALTTLASDASAVPATGSRARSRRGALAAAAALIVGGAAAGGVWIATRPGPARVTRTTIQTSGATALVIASSAPGSLAVTPDGSRVVYTAAGQLVVRRLDQFEPDVLTGLGSPTQPFVAPDGQWVGFFDRLVLKKVAITGGPPVTVVQDSNPGGGPMGATWGADGTIVFATSGADGLRRVGAAGGEVEALTTLDRARGEVRHVWPKFLPGGRALLFTIQYAVRGPDGARIALLDVETGARTVLLQGGSDARYLPSGHLVYGTEGTLRAVAFDLERWAVVGAPVPVLAPLAASQSGAYQFDVAADGTLVYLTMSGTLPEMRTLVWVDRQGRETPLGAEARQYLHPRLAPDGTRVAVLNTGDIWIWDLSRAMLTRGTLDGGNVSLWMPDSRRLIFSSARGGGRPNLYVQAVDGTGTTATRLTDSPNAQHATGLTPDGTQVVLNELTPTQQGDIRLLTLTPTPKVTPLVGTRFDERGGVVSPNGRWLAYESNRSGSFEIHVQPFPAVDDGHWQVSTVGGVQPLWARSGRELFYVAPDGALMVVAVETQGSVWSAGAPARLIDGRNFSGRDGTTVRQYDVTADGQRFLMMKEEAKGSEAPPSINVVQNWLEELKRLVPTK
jgi:serine/threonine-protein kinase